jgi:hypothetical protein
MKAAIRRENGVAILPPGHFVRRKVLHLGVNPTTPSSIVCNLLFELDPVCRGTGSFIGIPSLDLSCPATRPPGFPSFCCGVSGIGQF